MICYALVYHGFLKDMLCPRPKGYRFPKGLASRRAYGLPSNGGAPSDNRDPYGLSSNGDLHPKRHLSEHGDKPEHGGTPADKHQKN